MGQAPLLPTGVLSEALGYDGPDDVLVIVRDADADDRPPLEQAATASINERRSSARQLRPASLQVRSVLQGGASQSLPDKGSEDS